MCRDGLTQPGGSVKDLSMARLFISGGVAGVAYWALTYPTDVIKSSLQSDELQHSQRKYRGIVDCALKLYRDEGGWRRFFRGFSPCLLRSVPANATMLLVLEKSRQFVDPYL